MPDSTKRDSSGSGRSLPWQAVVAATALALTAAGLVLLYASNRDDDSDTAADAEAEALELRPLEDVPDGDPLEIAFTRDDDTTGTLRDVVGSDPVVVNLFASWCPPCIAEMPDFESVSQDLGDDVRFFGLAVNDRPEDAARIVEETGISYGWARDPKGDIAAAFGVTNMPSTILLSPDGEIVHIQSGAVDEEELRTLVDEHLGVPA